MTTEQSIRTNKVYTLGELARLYEVDIKTFKKWLEPLQPGLGERTGKFYLIPQVQLIFERLGKPEPVEINIDTVKKAA